MGTAYCCRDRIKHQHFLRCLLDDYAHYSKIAEDPQFDIVGKMLPGTNRRACGETGCRAFFQRRLIFVEIGNHASARLPEQWRHLSPSHFLGA